MRSLGSDLRRNREQNHRAVARDLEIVSSCVLVGGECYSEIDTPGSFSSSIVRNISRVGVFPSSVVRALLSE